MICDMACFFFYEIRDWTCDGKCQLGKFVSYASLYDINLVTQIWKINLKYPGSSQPTRRHSDCETTTNRQKYISFQIAQAWQPRDVSRQGRIECVLLTTA